MGDAEILFIRPCEPLRSYVRYYYILNSVRGFNVLTFPIGCSSACPTDLTVEYQIKPMGVDEPHPRFGWKMKHDTLRRGQTQRSYRIIVTDENGMTTWDTGDINSTKSVGIVYRGARLKSATRYSWRVETVDECGNKASATSFFETGLAVDSQLSYDNWDDARWIGDNNDNLIKSPPPP